VHKVLSVTRTSVHRALSVTSGYVHTSQSTQADWQRGGDAWCRGHSCTWVQRAHMYMAHFLLSSYSALIAGNAGLPVKFGPGLEGTFCVRKGTRFHATKQSTWRHRKRSSFLPWLAHVMLCHDAQGPQIARYLMCVRTCALRLDWSHNTRTCCDLQGLWRTFSSNCALCDAGHA